MRFLLLLFPAVALAQGIPIKDGDSSTLFNLDSAGRPTTKLVDKNAEELKMTDEGRLDTGRDVSLFRDYFVGSVVSAHNKWFQSSLTMTATVATGAITLNATAITTINTYSGLTTPAKFRGYGDGPLFFTARARPNNLPQTNATAELGLGNALTNAAPTDGAFFRWTASGGFECVVTRSSTESTGAITAPAQNVYSVFSIEIDTQSARCSWETPSSGATASVTVTLDSGAPSAFGESPGGLMRVWTSASAPALAPQLLVGAFEVLTKVVDVVRPVGATVAINGGGAAYIPTTGLQVTNHANSTSPTSATLSNTAAGYATLGGRYQFAAPLGAVTDYALFGYQVPTSYRFVMTGIRISSCNTGAAVATTATLLDWGVAVGSTAVSLATADAIAASPTSAPRRVPVGVQGYEVAAGIGRCAPDIVANFNDAPLTVESGRFVHVTLQVPIGTATASQVIRGDVQIYGYFEQ